MNLSRVGGFGDWFYDRLAVSPWKFPSEAIAFISLTPKIVREAVYLRFIPALSEWKAAQVCAGPAGFDAKALDKSIM